MEGGSDGERGESGLSVGGGGGWNVCPCPVPVESHENVGVGGVKNAPINAVAGKRLVM